MDLPLKWTVLFLIGATVVKAEVIADQYGFIDCVTDANRVMTATLKLWNNHSLSTRTYFSTEQFVEFTNNECKWNGTGAELDPFVAVVKINRTNDKAVPDSLSICGVNVTTQGEYYEWLVFTQRQKGFVRLGDSFVLYKCNASAILPTVLGASVTFRLPDPVTLPTNIGTITMRAVSSTNHNLEVSNLQVGDLFNLELKFQPSPVDETNVNADLKPWGAYCRTIYATPDSAYQYRKTPVLTDDGCSRTNEIFLNPTLGFTAVKPATTNVFYRAYTGDITAALFDRLPSDPNNPIVTNNVHFVCKADLCWRPDDQNCIDRCSAVGRRKRRSDTKPWLVTFTLVIGEDNTGNTADAEPQALPTYLWPVVGGIGVLILMLFAVFLFLCLRSRRSASKNRKYNQQRNTPSVASDISGKSGGNVWVNDNRNYK